MTNCIMLAHGRYRLTKQALESLYAHTPMKDFNLVVVHDSPSSDDFRVGRLLRSYTDRPNFSLLQVDNSGHVLAQLKNIGVAWSEQRFGRGDWLYLSDNDVWFSEGWLGKLTEIADRCTSEWRLFGGQVHPFHKPINAHGFFVDGAWDTELHEHSILDGPSWLMRWSTWKAFGPLDRTCAPGVCQSEEYGFCERLKQGATGMWGGENIPPGRIGVIHPHVVIHTGLTNSNGEPAPGADLRRPMIPKGVLAE